MITEVVGPEIERIKGEFESVINGMNMVGEIDYSTYSQLFDVGVRLIQEAYELGKEGNSGKEISKGFTGIEIDGVRFSNIQEMLIYMGKQRDLIIELEAQIEELKCCANCKYEEQGYMIEPCKSCNRYFQTLKVGARDKWEKR